MILTRHATPGPRHRDERLWWAVGAAVALHVVMLAGGHAPEQHLTGPHGSVDNAAAPSLDQSNLAPKAWQLLAGPQSPPRTAHHTADDQSTEHQAHIVSQSSGDDVTTPSPPPSVATHGAHQEAPFWRRHEVDQGPIPLHPVVISYPEGVQVVQAVRGVITLYIDEHGVVRRVEPKDQTLAPAMVQAARDAFLQARFQPALRQQAPARVQIDIEVQFDPPEAPPGNRSLTPGL